MNIFGYFPLFQSFTFCKSTSDIKKIQNKMAATQVALLLLSSILVLKHKHNKKVSFSFLSFLFDFDIEKKNILRK